MRSAVWSVTLLSRWRVLYNFASTNRHIDTMIEIISTDIIPVQKLMLFLGIFLGISLLVIAAIMLDLWDGVSTAKKLHKKVSEYWRFIVIGFLVDCIGFLFSFYVLPFMVMLFGIGLIVVEIKSMFEHAKRRKSQTAQLPDIWQGICDAASEKEAQQIFQKIASLLEDKKIEESKTV